MAISAEEVAVNGEKLQILQPPRRIRIKLALVARLLQRQGFRRLAHQVETLGLMERHLVEQLSAPKEGKPPRVPAQALKMAELAAQQALAAPVTMAAEAGT
jgi:hypothetical protein